MAQFAVLFNETTGNGACECCIKNEIARQYIYKLNAGNIMPGV